MSRPWCIFLWAVFAFTAVCIAGCNGPCRQLAERICECEPSSQERNACLQEVDSNANVREPNSDEDEICEDLLDTCDCEALDREDFQACGLTQRRGD